MATSFTFNPFTSTFDVISTVTLAAVGSTPNANGASISGQTLTLQPADATNPGLLTASTQFIGGDKYFSTSLQVNGTALTTTAVGATSKLILVGSFITSVSYSGSTPTVIGYKANGSEAVPTATTANQIINAITGRGHDGTNFSAGTRGRFCIHSSEVYASGAQGTYLTMSTTLTGTTTLSERMRIFDNGNVSIGNTTSTAKLSVTAALRHLADDGYGETERPARRIAADEVDAEALGAGKQAGGESRDEAFARMRQRNREQRPFRHRTHRRHVGHIDRQRLPAQRFRVVVGQEMGTRHHHVGGDHDFAPRRGTDQRRIVADTEFRVARRPLEMTLDQFEFGNHREPESADAFSRAAPPRPRRFAIRRQACPPRHSQSGGHRFRRIPWPVRSPR